MNALKNLNRHIAFKSLTGIVIMLVVLAVILSIIGYNKFSEALMEEYTNGAFRMCAVAKNTVDVKSLDQYLEEGGTSAAYKRTWDRLDEMCNATDATFVYVIVPDQTDYRHITYVFNVVNHDSKFFPYECGYTEETSNDDYRREYRLLMDGEKDQSLLVLADRKYAASTHHITAMIPLKNSKGRSEAILCVQRQMTELSKLRTSYLEDVIMATILLALLVLFGQGIYLNRMLINPIRSITKEASRFADENVPAQLKLTTSIRNNDEIGQLAGAVDQMEDHVYHTMNDLTAVTAEKERISAELNMASRIQAAMLPNIFPPFPDRKEFDLYATMTPAKAVGGDFYDFFLIDEDHLGLVMADVSGKGVPAALYMMISKTILQSCAMLGRSAAEVLNKTNEALSQNNKEEMFVTVWMGILEISTGTLSCSNAGHEYPVMKKPGGEFEMIQDKHGLVIGAMEGVRYTEYTLQMEPGSKLFLYTDGVPEAADADLRMFGSQRMLEALNTACRKGPEEVLQTTADAVNGFVKDAEQFDDMTMMCLEYHGNE